MASRDETRLVRVLRLLKVLRGRKRGAKASELMEELGVTRSSLYRYLRELESAQIPIKRDTVNGEVRLVLDGDWSGAPGIVELWVMAVAKQVLAGLEGSRALQWLAPRLGREALPVSLEPVVPTGSAVARAVEQAILDNRRLRLTCRGLKDEEPTARVVEPIELRFSARAWYLYAIDVDKGAPRTFKLPRVLEAQALLEACRYTSVIDSERAHRHSVQVWETSELHDVVIRLRPPFAAVAHEFLLTPGQRVEHGPDGCATIHARVAGLEEVTRWVL